VSSWSAIVEEGLRHCLLLGSQEAKGGEAAADKRPLASQANHVGSLFMEMGGPHCGPPVSRRRRRRTSVCGGAARSGARTALGWRKVNGGRLDVMARFLLQLSAIGAGGRATSISWRWPSKRHKCGTQRAGHRLHFLQLGARETDWETRQYQVREGLVFGAHSVLLLAAFWLLVADERNKCAQQSTRLPLSLSLLAAPTRKSDNSGPTTGDPGGETFFSRSLKVGRLLQSPPICSPSGRLQAAANGAPAAQRAPPTPRQ